MKQLLPIVVIVFLALSGFFLITRDTKVTTYYVSPNGDDINSGESADNPFKTIQKAVNLANAGDKIKLAEGIYQEDVITKRNGRADNPIVITGPKTAVLTGSKKSRVIEINHDYIHLIGFSVDGLSGQKDKLIYVQGKKSYAGLTGIKIHKMTVQNAGGECVRLRYFVKKSEVSYNTIRNCGSRDFVFDRGGKNGEGIYIGTAPEQRNDGRNPTRDADHSNGNHIHHNLINTQGNECVDVKEGSEGNIVEYNECTGQKDQDSAGLDSRGNRNVFRYNTVYGNMGAGIRLGGDDEGDGINNDAYGNKIFDNLSGGIKIQRTPQNKICGNIMKGNQGGNTVGQFRKDFNPTKPCERE